MKFIFGIICAASLAMISGCASTGSSAPSLTSSQDSYSPHQNNASTTAAKMISPVTQ